jgi:hypothetical protein
MKKLYKVKRKSQYNGVEYTENEVYAYNKQHVIDILIGNGYILDEKDIIEIKEVAV